ncbi:MAG TPA: PIN domain-containing protein [Thermoplasmata archaeon]|nr:PIN domain-containing protein [Thermoplasmata archaeon]
MIRAYLDTGVFLVFLDRDDSNSERVLDAAAEGLFLPVISFHTFQEATHNLLARRTKDEASWLRYFMWTLPGLEVVTSDRLQALQGRYGDRVADPSDLPHVQAYFAAECDRFVTVNRRLTRMAIREVVAFRTPREFLEELGRPVVETPQGI